MFLPSLISALPALGHGPGYSTPAPAGPGYSGPSTPAGPGPMCPKTAVQSEGVLPAGFIDTTTLVQISAQHPDVAFADSRWARVTPGDVCTIFNLELPVAATQGKVCNLVFDFPDCEQAPGRFAFDGPGTFTFTGYAVGAGAIPGETTFNHQPAPGPSPPSPPPRMVPGTSYIINAAPCAIPADIPGSVTVSGKLCSPDTNFTFKQSSDKCPLGIFVILTEGGAENPSY